ELNASPLSECSIRLLAQGCTRCLSAHWFLTLADAREKMETWRRFYNQGRPHSAIGYNVPISLTNHGGASGLTP
ncbi:MAG: integrase core domain-containing protein, partial [Pseudomonadota bacterium]